LLEVGEKDAMWNLGQSLDSKKVTSTLGYLDLKQICYCLAQAMNKHIEFSKGLFFLDDLKLMKEEMKDPTDLEFSYNLGEELKIDIDKLKAKKNEEKLVKKEAALKEFEDLKKKMESTEKSVAKPTPK